jgi:hypothetical protein
VENLLILTGWLGLLTAVWPWWRAWQTMRRTSLRDALLWLAAAWLCWLAAGVAYAVGQPLVPWQHLALSVTSCFLTAVLGARRPGLTAWNFVTVGLLAVLLLPYLEQSWQAPHWHLDEPRLLFLSVVLAVGLLNYLPTRFALPTLMVGGVVYFAVGELAESAPRLNATLQFGGALFGLAAAAWSAWLLAKSQTAASELEQLWRRFRNGFGAVWALRVMEQFNAAARHASWALHLTWFGLEPLPEGTPPPSEEVAQKLRAVLKRFLEDQ